MSKLQQHFVSFILQHRTIVSWKFWVTCACVTADPYRPHKVGDNLSPWVSNLEKLCNASVYIAVMLHTFSLSSDAILSKLVDPFGKVLYQVKIATTKQYI